MRVCLAAIGVIVVAHRLMHHLIHPTLASNGFTSSPLALARPIDLDNALRSLCKVSVLVCNDLRDASKSATLVKSSWYPLRC